MTIPLGNSKGARKAPKPTIAARNR